MQSALRHTARSADERHNSDRSTNQRSAVSALEDGESARARVARLLNRSLFVSLLALIFIAAIPYGTVEPWWKAAFVCLVFVLWILGTIEDLLSPRRRVLDK